MIAILLSTYNGEKYLRQQLDSLFSQTFSDFVLYVRDDGSSDTTMDILLEYESKYPNIVIFRDVESSNKGACMSFMWLLEKVEADYYMFCDQDDVWFPTKVQLTFDTIRSEECRSENVAVLVHSDLVVTNSTLNIISKSLWENDKTNPLIITRKYLRLVNYITGCTMLFNRKARDLAIKDTKYILMHDFWISICVDSSNGVIISLPIPTIYYRQHGNNVVGASDKKYRLPRLHRYFHMPDFEYSFNLYKMIKSKYKMNLIEYILLRLNFYLLH
jgi:glycosyltransferase involved in cell wall biosynthesis